MDKKLYWAKVLGFGLGAMAIVIQEVLISLFLVAWWPIGLFYLFSLLVILFVDNDWIKNGKKFVHSYLNGAMCSLFIVLVLMLVVL